MTERIETDLAQMKADYRKDNPCNILDVSDDEFWLIKSGGFVSRHQQLIKLDSKNGQYAQYAFIENILEYIWYVLIWIQFVLRLFTWSTIFPNLYYNFLHYVGTNIMAWLDIIILFFGCYSFYRDTIK